MLLLHLNRSFGKRIIITHLCVKRFLCLFVFVLIALWFIFESNQLFKDVLDVRIISKCAEELSTMSKNNFRGITLGVRPIEGLTFLP